MRSDLIVQAKRELAAAEEEHAKIVHQAHATVIASRKRYDIAKKRVQELQFAAASVELMINKERALQRR